VEDNAMVESPGFINREKRISILAGVLRQLTYTIALGNSFVFSPSEK
jgi:hypothetical protein